MDTSSDFFYTDGTLPLNNPSYVKRSADEELLKLVQQGQICYVLTTRQMGKSSLMARTAQQLKETGLNVAEIDLTSMGSQSITRDQWYFGLLDQLQEQLNLEVDPETWWEKHTLLSHVQRFTNFIRDEVLKKKRGKVVIFIDEIDTTLNFDFRDDFFAAIRSMHNAGATQPEFERLTFVLLGVASPSDLIQDTTRTPFNVGKGIELKEFSLPQANVLQKELETIYPTQGEAIFKRIYYWTSGHPYLTQTLCLTVAQKNDQNWTEEQIEIEIDALVEQLFFSETAQKDSNLEFVQNRILNSSEPRQLLKLYKQVYQGQIIKDDPQSPIQNQLKLWGLVKSEVRSQEVGKLRILKAISSLWPQQGLNGSSGADKPMYLAVRNRIYRRVFDLQWVKEHTQRDLGRIIAFVTVIVAFLAIVLAGYLLWHDTIHVPDQVVKAELKFYQADTPRKRATALATLFELQGIVSPIDYDEKAQNLFYDLEREEQLSLFKPYEVSELDLTTIVRGLYVTLADVDHTNSNEPLLSKMVYALEHAHTPETNALKEEVTHWLEGREQFTNEAFEDALPPYGTAIALNGDNPGTLYERAQVHIALSNNREALTDLDQVMAIARQAPTATSVPTSTNTPTPLPTNTPTASLAPTNTPSSNVILTATFTPSLPASIETAAVTPIATAQQAPFSSEFVTTIDRINAVQKLIDNNQALALLLAGTSDLYSNLQEFGLVRTPTSSGLIAFASDRNGDGDLEIYAMNADGINITQITNNPTNDYAVHWSPNGKQLVFQSSRDGNVEIYVMNSNGGELNNLTNHPKNDVLPRWSPDGKKVAFSSDRDESLDIYIVNADGTGITKLTNHSSNNWNPSWSPNGEKIAFVSDRDGNEEIYVMNMDGTSLTNLTRNEANDSGPCWSPDGNMIAFHSNRQSIDDRRDIFVMNHDGTSVNRLTNTPGNDQIASWSPDGTQIIFESWRDGNGEIYKMSSDGAGLTNLTNHPSNDRYPSWQKPME